MLTHIQIRDFAIIDAVELELGNGLTVLTGETGAGKSILVDALLVAAGGRAGAEVVRHGTERAEVSATFGVEGNSAALDWLNEQAIEHDGECVLRRVVGSDGRSRGYVNGQSMSVQSLRQLGETLLDVHGQMEYQSLMRRAAQRDLLDRNGDYDPLVRAVTEQWRTMNSLRQERDEAAASAKDRDARLEMLRYHLTELNALDLKAGEIDELAAESVRLSQRGKLAEGARNIVQLLRETEDVSAEQSVSRALTIARTLGDLDPQFTPIARLIDESLIALREGVESVERYESSLDADPGRQEWVEQRLAAIETLARKHRVEPAALIATQAELTEELERLEKLEASLESIEARLKEAARRFQSACTKLSTARKAAAKDLSERVSALMQTLGMPGGKFQVQITALAPEDATQYGADDIEFLVSANPGQPPRPLAKVASGGELSRISLAIQVAAAQTETLPCLVFDEVDAGVGGGVAEIVGRQLRTLGDRTQVLCVTHLPQVASQAHGHVRVSKLTDGKTTRTSLHPLTMSERVEEIARMLGGVDITDRARAHAAEMLQVTATPARPAGRAKRKSR
ncbi:DNA repair protein RecN (Recombination protein N) [Povalibacter uvarum]|uniref:DNA repair protein RecN n=1 Tax=Povalibacter uvarum TaxID=732238 RepID=A0A841HGG3_9GAMM|nr:DNA repair protein RecN [Povalibacter uvarum]MBB6091866.1 DNA repair protein RecN (Recombination protein N) [Povalibacter uvarum]